MKNYEEPVKEDKEECNREQTDEVDLVNKSTKEEIMKEEEPETESATTKNFEGLKENTAPTQRVINGPAARKRSNVLISRLRVSTQRVTDRAPTQRVDKNEGSIPQTRLRYRDRGSQEKCKSHWRPE